MHEMINKYTKRKIEECWNYQCAVCGRNDYLEFHHLIPKAEGGSDDYDNIILLCSGCHAAVHGRIAKSENPHPRTSIDYETAKPILAAYFANEVGTKETKEKLNLSQKTHLTESSLYRRYKREHNITKFYNNVDLVNSKRRNHV